MQFGRAGNPALPGGIGDCAPGRTSAVGVSIAVEHAETPMPGACGRPAAQPEVGGARRLKSACVHGI